MRPRAQHDVDVTSSGCSETPSQAPMSDGECMSDDLAGAETSSDLHRATYGQTQVRIEQVKYDFHPFHIW